MNKTSSSSAFILFIRLNLSILAAVGLGACGGNDKERDELIQSVRLAVAIDNGTIISNVDLFLRNGNQRIINENEDAQLGATATLENGSQVDVSTQITWASSDTSILQVSNSGLLTGISAGLATLTGTTRVPNAVITEVAFTVSDATIVPTTLEILQPSPATACTTLSAQISPVEFSDNSLRNITEWANWSIADINQGRVINTSPTDVSIVLFTQQDVTLNINVDDTDYSQTITASATPSINAALASGNTVLALGDTEQLLAESTYQANGITVTESVEAFLDWSSSNAFVASITGSTVSGASEGTATVSATCGDLVGALAAIELEVVNQVFMGIIFEATNEQNQEILIGPSQVDNLQIFQIDNGELEIRAFAFFDTGLNIRDPIEDVQDWEITRTDSTESIDDVVDIIRDEDFIRLIPRGPGILEILVFYNEDDDDNDDDDDQSTVIRSEVLNLEFR